MISFYFSAISYSLCRGVAIYISHLSASLQVLKFSYFSFTLKKTHEIAYVIDARFLLNIIVLYFSIIVPKLKAAF